MTLWCWWWRPCVPVLIVKASWGTQVRLTVDLMTWWWWNVESDDVIIVSVFTDPWYIVPKFPMCGWWVLMLLFLYPWVVVTVSVFTSASDSYLIWKTLHIHSWWVAGIPVSACLFLLVIVWYVIGCGIYSVCVNFAVRGSLTAIVLRSSDRATQPIYLLIWKPTLTSYPVTDSPTRADGYNFDVVLIAGLPNKK